CARHNSLRDAFRRASFSEGFLRRHDGGHPQRRTGGTFWRREENPTRSRPNRPPLPGKKSRRTIPICTRFGLRSRNRLRIVFEHYRSAARDKSVLTKVDFCCCCSCCNRCGPAHWTADGPRLRSGGHSKLYTIDF